MISIVTINLNNLSGLIKTVESVKSQILINFDWFIIDGNSNDGSVEFINQIDFPGLHKIIGSDNGIYDAMNKGIDLVNKDSITLFLNSGDYLYSNTVLSDIAHLASNVDILFGDFGLITNNNPSLIHKIKQPERLDFTWLFSKTINHQSYFIRGSLLKRYKFDLLYSVCADWAQMMSILLNESHLIIKKVPIIISIYDINGYSSRTNEKRLYQRTLFLKNNLPNSLYDSLKYISGLHTKSNFNQLVNLSKSKWRWRLLSFIIKVIG